MSKPYGKEDESYTSLELQVSIGSGLYSSPEQMEEHIRKHGGSISDKYQVSFANFDQVNKYYRPQSAKRGMRLASWARVFKTTSREDTFPVEDTYHLHIKQMVSSSYGGWKIATSEKYGDHSRFAIIRPDNTIEFPMSISDVSKKAQTLSCNMYSIIPFGIFRISSGRYRLYDTHSGGTWKYRETCPEYFAGIKFNMLTGECLNRQPDKTTIEIPEKRLEWRRKLATYKKGLKARAKLGAFDSHIQTLEVAKNTRHNSNDWSSSWVEPDRINLLHTSMVNVDYSQELLTEIVKSCMADRWHRSNVLNSNDIKFEIDRIFKQASIPLRKKFGVFKQNYKNNMRISDGH